ncbi:TPA: hypothetical protein VOM56_001322 [Streptococcus pyogenes]|nr:hypothetical protein [Streptococcus pyogenes]
MAKTKFERLSVIHRREILWLKWYFLRDKTDSNRTILEQKIHNCFLEDNREDAAYYVNLNTVTSEVISNTDESLVRVLKEVYVYETMNVIGASQRIYYRSPNRTYKHLNNWFDNYFRATYRHLLANALEER